MTSQARLPDITNNKSHGVLCAKGMSLVLRGLRRYCFYVSLFQTYFFPISLSVSFADICDNRSEKKEIWSWDCNYQKHEAFYNVSRYHSFKGDRSDRHFSTSTSPITCNWLCLTSKPLISRLRRDHMPSDWHRKNALLASQRCRLTSFMLFAGVRGVKSVLAGMLNRAVTEHKWRVGE